MTRRGGRALEVEVNVVATKGRPSAASAMRSQLQKWSRIASEQERGGTADSAMVRMPGQVTTRRPTRARNRQHAGDGGEDINA